ncbi:MAG TPA: I78 family peptidase inhibitor [Allosphingosinicella sp.]|jgi:hypothetical protein
MRIFLATTAAATLLIGCATAAPPAPPEEQPVPEHGAGSCNAEAARGLVGRQRSDAVGAEALRLSGARTLRWLAPDSLYTMDLRQDRINIDVNANGRVTGLRCF